MSCVGEAIVLCVISVHAIRYCYVVNKQNRLRLAFLFYSLKVDYNRVCNFSNETPSCFICLQPQIVDLVLDYTRTYYKASFESAWSGFRSRTIAFVVLDTFPLSYVKWQYVFQSIIVGKFPFFCLFWLFTRCMDTMRYNLFRIAVLVNFQSLIVFNSSNRVAISLIIMIEFYTL